MKLLSWNLIDIDKIPLKNLSERDKEIFKLCQDPHTTYVTIADKFGLSGTRVQQIHLRVGRLAARWYHSSTRHGAIVRANRYMIKIDNLLNNVNINQSDTWDNIKINPRALHVLKKANINSPNQLVELYKSGNERCIS